MCLFLLNKYNGIHLSQARSGYHTLPAPLQKIVWEYTDPAILWREEKKHEKNPGFDFVMQDLKLDWVENHVFRARCELLKKIGPHANPSFSIVFDEKDDPKQSYQNALMQVGSKLCEFIHETLTKRSQYYTLSGFVNPEDAAVSLKLSMEEFTEVLSMGSEASNLAKVSDIYQYSGLLNTCFNWMWKNQDNLTAADISGSLIKLGWNLKSIVNQDTHVEYNFIACILKVNRNDIVLDLLARWDLSDIQRKNILISAINIAHLHENVALIKTILPRFFAMTDPSFAKEEKQVLDIRPHLEHYQAATFQELISHFEKMITNLDLRAIQSVTWFAYTDPKSLSMLEKVTHTNEYGWSRLLQFIHLLTEHILAISSLGNCNIPENYMALLPICLNSILKIREITIYFNDALLGPVLKQTDFTQLPDVLSKIPADNPFKDLTLHAASESKEFSKQAQNALIKAAVLEPFKSFCSLHTERFNCYIELAEPAPNVAVRGLKDHIYGKYGEQALILAKHYIIACCKLELTAKSGFGSYFYLRRINHFLSKIREIPLSHPNPDEGLRQILQTMTSILWKSDELFRIIYSDLGGHASPYFDLGQDFDYIRSERIKVEQSRSLRKA